MGKILDSNIPTRVIFKLFWKKGLFYLPHNSRKNLANFLGKPTLFSFKF